MAENIGVNVIEVSGATAPSITGAAVSVGGFVVQTARGVPHQPVRITSFAEFVERFGGYVRSGMGAHLVRGFFDNGGRVAVVSRVTGGAAAPATLTLKSASGADALAVTAGYRGQGDPGTWGGALYVMIRHSSSATSRLREHPARITGANSLQGEVDLSAAPSLSVEVDDVATCELRFGRDELTDPAAATPEQIRDAVNRQSGLLVADLQEGRLRLTSTGAAAVERGTRTGLRVTGDNAVLGFTVEDQPRRGDIVSFGAGGAALDTPRLFAVGSRVTVSADEQSAQATLTSVDAASGRVTWAPDLPQHEEFDQLAVEVASAEFDLLVAQGAPDEEHVVEGHLGLSMAPDLPNYAPEVLNNPLTGSRFLRVAVKRPENPLADDRPAESDWQSLQGGADGAPTNPDFIGDQANRRGLFAFDPFDIQLLCCEQTNEEVANAALAYCARRGDAMFVGTVPKGSVASGGAARYGARLQSVAGSYGALYGPWIVVPDPIGIGPAPRITVPPMGHVMGVCARTEATRGIWKAPAGDEANLLGVLDVESMMSDVDHTLLVTQGCVNGIRAVPRAGIVVDASRTLSNDARWRYVNVRLLFNYVKSSLRDGLRWVRQEPNRELLWTAVRYGTVTPFLTGLWRRGAFGTGTAEETFTVVVDRTNNPPDQVEQGRLTVEVYFYPSRPAETIVIMVGQQPGGGLTAES